MILDFNTIEKNEIPEFKGGKGKIIAAINSDENGKILHGMLPPGSSIGEHTHETSSEMIYIISGNADFIYDGGTESVGAGGCHYCPKGHSHSMINKGTEDIVFFAVVPEQ